MDYLFLNATSFPVRNGILTKSGGGSGAYHWSIEINCDESPQADPDESLDDPKADTSNPTVWVEQLTPMLYANYLPLHIESPDELIGRDFAFPHTPHDDSADWPRGIGWPFFVLYAFEHECAYPTRLAFGEKRDQQYRVEITGYYPWGDKIYDIRVEAWLDWRVNARQTLQ